MTRKFPCLPRLFQPTIFLVRSAYIHLLYGKVAAHWIYFCLSPELSFTFNTYKLAHDVVIIPNIRTG